MSDGLQFGFSDDAAEIAVGWLQSLKSERRMAPKRWKPMPRCFNLAVPDGSLGNRSGDLSGIRFSQLHGGGATGSKATLARSFRPSVPSSALPAERHFSNAAAPALPACRSSRRHQAAAVAPMCFQQGKPKWVTRDRADLTTLCLRTSYFRGRWAR
jgi:hypothetical protein